MSAPAASAICPPRTEWTDAPQLPIAPDALSAASRARSAGTSSGDGTSGGEQLERGDPLVAEERERAELDFAAQCSAE